MNFPLVTMCDSFDVHLERFLTIFDYQFAIFCKLCFLLAPIVYCCEKRTKEPLGQKSKNITLHENTCIWVKYL